MPINRLLENGTCGVDQINEDPLTEMVARKVVELGRSGTTDPAQIATLAVKALRCGPSPPSAAS
jgi:hypothetical protein